MKTVEEIKEEIKRCRNEAYILYTPPVSINADGANRLNYRAKVLEWVLDEEEEE